MATNKNQEMTPTKTGHFGVPYPITSLRREMDRLFDDFLGGSFFTPTRWGLPELPGDLTPEIDVKENGKEMVLTAELPGMDEKDIELSVSDGVLTLKGEKKMEKREEKDDYRVMERRYGSFQRSFSLPDSVNQDAIKADFDKGVLKVTMPKKAEAKKAEKKIKIG